VLRELVTVYRQLSGLALQDADLASVTQLLADRTAATVAVVSPVMDVMAAASPAVPPEEAAATVRTHVVHPRLGQVLRASRQGHRALWLPSVGGMPAIIVAPILVGDEVLAHLITVDPAEKNADEDMSLLVTEHAATICGVILGREHVAAAASRRVRDDLVEGLLLGRGRDDSETGRWAAHLGYDAGRDHHVVVIAFHVPPPRAAQDADALQHRVRDVIEHFLATRAPDVITSARESEVVLVAAADGQRRGSLDPRQLAETCLARLAELFPDTKVLAGIGGACRDPREITRSYEEAHRTIETLRRMGRAGTVTAFEDLGIHRLLLQVPDLAELRSFADDVLGKLGRGERERRGEYLTTLSCYLRENGSPQRAARFLHVHPNTVAYRVKRIEEITGLALDNYRDRLTAQVALEILDALGDEP
jgi:sugar diacid utilization regulator